MGLESQYLAESRSRVFIYTSVRTPNGLIT